MKVSNTSMQCIILLSYQEGWDDQKDNPCAHDSSMKMKIITKISRSEKTLRNSLAKILSILKPTDL